MQWTQPVDPMTCRHRVPRILWAVLCIGWMSCGLQAAETALNPAPAPVVEKTLVVLGDSLSAGFGVDPAEAWPARIQEKIREARLPWKLVNAGVSGDTSAGGLRRLDWILRRPLEALLIELEAMTACEDYRSQPPAPTCRRSSIAPAPSIRRSAS